MWRDPAELPGLAILNQHKADKLLDFCTLLKDEGILEMVCVIVLLDELARETADGLEKLGVVPIPKSSDPWPKITAVMEQVTGSQTAKLDLPHKLRRGSRGSALGQHARTPHRESRHSVH
jgi:hypothetical protein